MKNITYTLNDDDAWDQVDYLADILIAFGWVLRFAVAWTGFWAVIKVTVPLLKAAGLW